MQPVARHFQFQYSGGYSYLLPATIPILHRGETRVNACRVSQKKRKICRIRACSRIRSSSRIRSFSKQSCWFNVFFLFLFFHVFLFFLKNVEPATFHWGGKKHGIVLFTAFGKFCFLNGMYLAQLIFVFFVFFWGLSLVHFSEEAWLGCGAMESTPWKGEPIQLQREKPTVERELGTPSEGWHPSTGMTGACRVSRVAGHWSSILIIFLPHKDPNN